MKPIVINKIFMMVNRIRSCAKCKALGQAYGQMRTEQNKHTHTYDTIPLLKSTQTNSHLCIFPITFSTIKGEFKPLASFMNIVLY